MIVNRNPRVLTDRLSNNFGHIINDILNETQPVPSTIKPALELAETDKHYDATLIIAGVPKDKISISIDDGILSVTADLKKNLNKESKSLYSDITYGTYLRKIQLPKQADPTKVEATLTDGLLHIKIAKAENKLPRTVEIK